jgi:hypothetical protein
VDLARVDVYVFISVFSLAVIDGFSVEVLVLVEWIIRPKSVGVDCQRLLLVVVEEESNGRFVSGFLGDDVSLIAPTINECEHRRLVITIVPAARS